MIHLIAVASRSPDEAAERIAGWLGRTCKLWIEPLAQLWIADGPLAADQILNGIVPLLNHSDRLLVVKLGTEAAWKGLPSEIAGWIADAFPGAVATMPQRPEGGSPP